MRRSIAALTLGAALWAASSIIGSVALRMLAAAFLVLPLIAWCWSNLGRRSVQITRQVSSPTVPVGTPLDVVLTIRTQGTRDAPHLFLDETIPASLGTPVRLCLEGVSPGIDNRVSYSLLPTLRGRMIIGPSTIRISDPFLLSTATQQTTQTDSVIVTPLLEPLIGIPEAGREGAFGVAPARRSWGHSDEFASIRAYASGDDLRRIHWPSVARSGQMMLRQDEARQSAGTTVYIDTRAAALGRSGDIGFERAVSAAASLGVHLGRGTVLHLATSQHAPVAVSSQELLITLASIAHTEAAHSGVERLGAYEDPTVVTILAPPEDPRSLIRACARATTRIACLILPPPGTTAGAIASDRRTAARLALQVAGWTVIELDATASLVDRWNIARRTHATSA